MNTRIINIVIGLLFAMSGAVTLIDGIYNVRASNLCIGICFVIVGGLYFARKKERQ